MTANNIGNRIGLQSGGLISSSGNGASIDNDAAYARLADHVLELNEQLRHARGQLARYGETLLAVQRSILPQSLPEVPTLDVSVHFREAERVGGDFYDVIPVGPGRWAIVICDVSGHGLAAAAILSLVHALASTFENQKSPPSPGDALALINRPLATRYLANSEHFVTAFIGIYDVRSQVLNYASAGHPPPRLVRGNAVRLLDGSSGLPLGLDPTSIYIERSVQLLPGDRLVLFTDGVVESTNADEDFFGEDRLNEAVRCPAGTAAEMVHNIVAALQSFRAGSPIIDDETCLIAVVEPGSRNASPRKQERG